MASSDLTQLFAELERDYLPYLSVNGVIFGANNGELKVLLMQSAGTGTWSLPGGYVRRQESVDDAAARMVEEMTGLSHPMLRQFHTFGGPARGEAVVADTLNALGVAVPTDHWVLGRVVSVGYVALVDAQQAPISQSPFSRVVAWCDVATRPRLIIDHDEMVERALAAVRAQIDALAMTTNALPAAFTMPELRQLHETVLGRSLDRRNFQKRMLEIGLVARLPKLRTGGRRKPTYLYEWVTPTE
jgi:ADP-ribose pyrophosphatase YjhB (NUDIX family)